METIFKTEKSCLKISEVDIYGEGCQPETSQMVPCDIEFQASSPLDLIDIIKKYFDVENDSILLNSCDEVGRIDVQVLENSEGYSANKREIEDWKAGQEKLWACTYSFKVNKHLVEPVDFCHIIEIF